MAKFIEVHDDNGSMIINIDMIEVMGFNVQKNISIIEMVMSSGDHIELEYESKSHKLDLDQTYESIKELMEGDLG